MSEHRLPAPPPPFDWKAGGWPLLAGGIGVVGALAYYFYGMMQKDKKMTKFEKACLAFVVALGEKTEELEKRRAELADQLAESDRKRIEIERKLAETERKLGDETARADRAERRAEELLTEMHATAPAPVVMDEPHHAPSPKKNRRRV